MATFNGNIKVIADALLQSSLDIGTGKHQVKYEKDQAFTNGTGANQANEMFSDTRQLGISTSEDLDLSGSLTDAFGTSIVFTSIKALIIKADDDNGDNLIIGGAAANAISTIFSDTSDKLILHPGGTLCLIAPGANGYVVTAGTADLLKIENADSGAVANYDIIIVGEVA